MLIGISICRELRQAEGVDAAEALKTSKLVVPAVHEKLKSPELKARLEKLQKQAEHRQYQALVADITVAVRAFASAFCGCTLPFADTYL